MTTNIKPSIQFGQPTKTPVKEPDTKPETPTKEPDTKPETPEKPAPTKTPSPIKEPQHEPNEVPEADPDKEHEYCKFNRLA